MALSLFSQTDRRLQVKHLYIQKKSVYFYGFQHPPIQSSYSYDDYDPEYTMAKYRAELPKWRKLKRIHLLNPMFASILEPLLQIPDIAAHLTDIQLRLVNLKNAKIIATHNHAKSLVDLLKHCPHLEHFTMTNSILLVKDLDTLHANCPELVSLQIGIPVIDADKMNELQNASAADIYLDSPAVNLKKLSLSAYHLEDATNPDESAYVRWINYIRYKYPNIEDIRFVAERADVDEQQSLQLYEAPLEIMIQQCTHIKHYAIVNLCPITKRLQRQLDTRMDRLESVCIRGHPDLINSQLYSLEGQCHSIKKLHMETCQELYDDSGWFGNHLSRWIHLQEVNIDSRGTWVPGFWDMTPDKNWDDYRSTCDMYLLITILQYAANVTSITVQGLTVSDLPQIVPTLSQPTRLRKLKLQGTDGERRANMLGRMLNTMLLPFCPLLNEFSLKYSSMTVGPLLVIDFKHQYQLQNIYIERNMERSLWVKYEPSGETRWYRYGSGFGTTMNTLIEMDTDPEVPFS
ncbi:hypothetical protein MBANPS3_004106 [Mucor bainieri]